MKRETLIQLVGDDELGLLKVKSRVPEAMTQDERLLSAFKEIEEFVKAKGRTPEPNSRDMHEFKLHSRLSGINDSPAKAEALRPIDNFGLIKRPVETITDVLDDDDMGLLEPEPESIFTLRNVPAHIQMPERIASRKPCEDFATFEPFFLECQKELKAGIREMRPFTGEQQIQPGHFFVLNGVMAYVAEVGEKEIKNKKVNARLRCIFENGTESNMLLRSLATELYKDPNGRRILDHNDKALEELELIKDDDVETGYIYILSSLSERDDVQSIEHLYKVGYSTVPVPQRIKNAKREPTYLMAGVKIISAYKCYNLNPQKFENLLHTFFGKCCLEVQVIDESGRKHIPREWFIAPLPAIEMAVQLLINRDIVHYRYDADRQQVVER
ncbi:hypothetical protein XaraCFBP7407_19795 [Xanthomonas arboricola pv. arracaciae]|uniref:GIY-YIG nuclease family protein n=1 Tax=Xanthomonas arboricola TaxID=56448 RepID=UPI000CEE9876|nr:GIY-YIG nuclease family protein [Xanthomonas arboricola]PPT92434.1 hypothetical protein XaraCFBP7407_19795 [Xanthomonas arboricola pv. arracaciae]